MDDLTTFLQQKACALRLLCLDQTTHASSGHLTTCLSAADIVATLFFYAMCYDLDHFNHPGSDRFILSKGHASPLLYAIWKELGALTADDLAAYRQFDSFLEGHPTFRFKYTEAATGSLGIGLSIGCGEAIAARMDNNDITIYVLLGDAEIIEGSVWEAVQIASFYNLSNVVAIVDCNRLGQSSATMIGHDLQHYQQRFEAFGWHAQVVDGHNVEQLVEVIDIAKQVADKPKVILAHTLKGKGISWLEDRQGFHGKALPAEEYERAKKDLLLSCPSGLSEKKISFVPSMPNGPFDYHGDISWIMPPSPYNKNDLVSTRQAFGQALAALGNVCDRVVSLDAEVKNSTFAQIFEQQHSKRFVQCFIAEQNMVSMAVGMHRRNKIPFVSTFSCFFSRAHDQVRMSAIGQSALRLVGSHAGVSIGHDGPSQMGLEDIGMMRALPQSVVLYPSDAQSTWKLVDQMSNYHHGISYLRTTRSATPVLYNKNEEFIIGGCKVLHESQNDVACIIAAGITLHEALSAYHILQQQGIAIAVIDSYSIKPLDTQTIARCAQQASKKIITVEDHYLQGGLGQTVAYELRNDKLSITCLAVTELPRSGSPQELLAWAGIDAQAIVDAVKALL